MALKIQSKSKTPSKANLLKISKYENTQEAINLMAKICSIKKNDNPISLDRLLEIYDRLKQYEEEAEENPFDTDFISNIGKIISDIKIYINQNEVKGYTKVVVAGGYSAGKSSMINKVTNIGKLLPEGIEPVSVIATYVYCTNKNNTRKIQGENLKGSLVDLDESVLECIQHSSKSKIYLASVLEKIYVETYAPEYEGIVFIDTPGYNNSANKNVVNSRTDKETAITEFSQGDVLLWLIDCEAGTISTTDLEIINQFNGKKIIVFTKSDKKDEKNIQDIISLAAKQLNINNNENIIDILAFSTEKGFTNSYNGNTNESLVSILKDISPTHSILGDLESAFDNKANEISEIIELTNLEVEDCIKNLTEINKIRSRLNNSKYAKYLKNLKENTENIMDNYIEIKDSFFAMDKVCINAIDYLHDEIKYREDTIFSKPSDDTYRKFKNLSNAYYSINCSYYDDYSIEECKEDLIKLIDETLENEINELDSEFKKYNTWKDHSTEGLKQYKKHITALGNFYSEFSNEIRRIIEEHSAYRKKEEQRQSNQDEVVYNIFDAIKIDNMQAFYNSLAKGVDITICNEEKYNPITWAVRYGNNEIVKVFLNENIDFSIKDENGFNALETAVIHQFKDIYQLIIASQADKFTKSDLENLLPLAEEHKYNFKNWLDNTIHNNTL